jgi:hypothetical protein
MDENERLVMGDSGPAVRDIRDVGCFFPPIALSRPRVHAAGARTLPETRAKNWKFLGVKSQSLERIGFIFGQAAVLAIPEASRVVTSGDPIRFSP